MNPDLGRHLSIRATAYVAGEPVPFFWPMRGFIHHNPLHGFEHLPFAEAVTQGARLFHAQTFLPRRQYQGYLNDGDIEGAALDAQIAGFAAERPALPGIDLALWAGTLLKGCPDPILPPGALCSVAQVQDALQGKPVRAVAGAPAEVVAPKVQEELSATRPVYESVDRLFGTAIGEELDELVIRACLDFFDEGQSAWVMPHRDEGFFAAWRAVAGRRAQKFLDRIEAAGGRDGGQGAETPLSPERVIDHVLSALGVAEEHWHGYFTNEIARLHGWAGFIRWRASAKRYFWAKNYPGDLVDLLAVRLTLGWLLLQRRAGRRLPRRADDMAELARTRPLEMFLRLAYHRGEVLPEDVRQIDAALSRGRPSEIDRVAIDHLQARARAEAARMAASLQDLADRTGQRAALAALSVEDLTTLIAALRDLEAQEGMIWLRALEAHATGRLLSGLTLEAPVKRGKRPFVQAAFCIDTRSERIRRHLEGVGDYQTFGIAGFFGVPVSLIELGKGSELHLCPVLLTPKNLVLEMSSAVWTHEAALTTLERVMHELKESVLSPFVTVEAIGLLFGFDMIGKTMAPQAYNTWRQRLHDHKPNTHLMLDKLSRDQADSVVRAVQRAVIIEALEHELRFAPEEVTDDIVREVRERALGSTEPGTGLASRLGITTTRLADLVDRLRKTYRINRSFAELQMEHLGRVGFSLEEQVGFVHQALSSIGLTENFSRFVLIVGHGSTSENNPYESALDCGACGGNDGLVSARVLAQMANKHAVRRKLRERGIDIPDDAWFMPAMHNTVTDEITLHDLELLPTTHLVYLDRLRTGLTSAARLCAQERLPTLEFETSHRPGPAAAFRGTRRNALDWSQVRPEWGLSGNAYFVIGRRDLTKGLELEGRAFLHSYDYRVDPKRRLLENILTGPLVVGQWINLEHYFSAVDNERFGSGSKVYHNVAGQFGVMTGNLSDLRTGLPSQTVLAQGRPYHQPLRLITLIEAPFEAAKAAIANVASVKRLVNNGWIRIVVLDPETGTAHVFDESDWVAHPGFPSKQEERIAS